MTRDGGTLVVKPKMWAKTPKGSPCIGQAMRIGRYRNYGGCARGANTEAGKRRRAAATRVWWAMWDPKARRRYMSAVATQVDKMR